MVIWAIFTLMQLCSYAVAIKLMNLPYFLVRREYEFHYSNIDKLPFVTLNYA